MLGIFYSNIAGKYGKIKISLNIDSSFHKVAIISPSAQTKKTPHLENYRLLGNIIIENIYFDNKKWEIIMCSRQPVFTVTAP